jgi:hypothetical protein
MNTCASRIAANDGVWPCETARGRGVRDWLVGTGSGRSVCTVVYRRHRQRATPAASRREMLLARWATFPSPLANAFHGKGFRTSGGKLYRASPAPNVFPSNVFGRRYSRTPRRRGPGWKALTALLANRDGQTRTGMERGIAIHS